MTHPDSIYGNHIEIIPDGLKTKEIWQKTYFFAKTKTSICKPKKGRIISDPALPR
jgi:hypothetical protein